MGSRRYVVVIQPSACTAQRGSLQRRRPSTPQVSGESRVLRRFARPASVILDELHEHADPPEASISIGGARTGISAGPRPSIRLRALQWEAAFGALRGVFREAVGPIPRPGGRIESVRYISAQSRARRCLTSFLSSSRWPMKGNAVAMVRATRLP